jgi:hypothetical protein
MGLPQRSAPVRIRVSRHSSPARHGPDSRLVPQVGDGAPDSSACHAGLLKDRHLCSACRPSRAKRLTFCFSTITYQTPDAREAPIRPHPPVMARVTCDGQCHLFSLVEGMARTRWPSDPRNPGLFPGQADQTGSAGGCQKTWDPAGRSFRRTARAASADSEVRPGPGPSDPTPASSPSGKPRQEHHPHSPCRIGSPGICGGSRTVASRSSSSGRLCVT